MRARLKAARSCGYTSGRAMGAGSSSSSHIIDGGKCVVNIAELSHSVSDSSASLRAGSQPAPDFSNSTIKVSLTSKQRRYKLQAAAAELLPDERVAWCSQRLVEGARYVDVCTHQGGAHYAGLAVCGSIWSCPVCAARVAAKRREELSKALERWQGSAVMATLTLAHERDDTLDELLDALRDSWRRMKSGAWWQGIRAKYQLRAYVTALETTWSPAHGWHVHLHCLFFSGLLEARFDAHGFESELYSRYVMHLERHERWASSEHGVHVRIGDRAAGDYVAKLDYELTHAAVTKNGRGGMSPMQLLERYAEDGAGWAGLLFVEYVKCFSGRKQLTYSHGARQVLGLDEEQTDEELASAEEEQADSQVLISLTLQQFKRVYRAGKRAELLEVATAGDAWSCWQWLQDTLGIIPELWQVDIFVMEDG